MELKILKSKEIKKIKQIIKEQWNAELDLDCGFLMRGNDILIISRDINRINTEKLRINSIGLYFGELRHGELRLSIEGSQLIGPRAKKNIIELNDEEAQQWLKGEEIAKEINAKGFLIVKHNTDFMGCTKCKDGKLLNYVPKARRIKTSNSHIYT